jgi:hypothetical protein
MVDFSSQQNFALETQAQRGIRGHFRSEGLECVVLSLKMQIGSFVYFAHAAISQELHDDESAA